MPPKVHGFDRPRIFAPPSQDFDELNSLFAEYTGADSRPASPRAPTVSGGGFGIAIDIHATDGGAAARALAGACTRGLLGDTRETEDSEMLCASLALLRSCCETDALVADEAWADEPLGEVLCACVETVGVDPAAVMRLGSTRSIFVAREERFGGARKGGGVGRGSDVLVGWPAEEAAKMQRRVLELLTSMTRRMPNQVIPRASAVAMRNAAHDPDAKREVVTEQRATVQAKVAARVAAAVSAAVCRQLTVCRQNPRSTPPPLLVQCLMLLEPLCLDAPSAMRAGGRSDSLAQHLSAYAVAINSNPSSRTGSPGKLVLGPGAVDAACHCLMVLRALVHSDTASALALCRGRTLPQLLDALSSPMLSGGLHDARLLLHSVDLLFAVSADASAPTWPLVVSIVQKHGGMCTLLEHLAKAPPTLLALVIATIADWMRDPSLRAEFRSWRAPPGLLVRDESAEEDEDATAYGSLDGADALRLILRAWQFAETNPHAAMLVRVPKPGKARPMAIALLEPLPAHKPPPAWRRAPADRASGVEEAVAARVMQAAPLHARVGALVQVLRFAGGADGVTLPPLPPSEAALLTAAECDAGLQMSRSFRQVDCEIAKEGWAPVLADLTRLKEKRHAGGSRVDGVWAAQESICDVEAATNANFEAVTYQKLVMSKNSDPMKLPSGGLVRSQGKRTLEQRRRGQLAMTAMLGRVKTKWTPDGATVAEAHATERALHGCSKLAAREAAWMFEASLNKNDNENAATKVQAAHRGKKARENVGAERFRREQLLVAVRPTTTPTVLEATAAYEAQTAPPRAKPRPVSAHN